ncbi:hypothetical protein [Pantoea sp. 18069]|uniref:hypothetical protein n=1 Tax=Pantoea sp. 18069 TaxID=2681415 RepID=UPI0013573239|nr:hypothetical protein [Pantoea sp. 18069]
MDFLSLRTAAVLSAAVVLSGCSGLRMPAMPSLPGWISAPRVQAPAAPTAAPAALQPSDRTETWQGLYRQHADAGRFTECRTGAEMPVAQAGDSALLESAYTASRSAPGAPVFVEVQGRWVQRARADMPPSANARELVLLVERFVSVSSQTSCAGW